MEGHQVSQFRDLAGSVVRLRKGLAPGTRKLWTEMILSVNRGLSDLHLFFSGHSNAILLSLPSMPFSILECIRPEHGHSRLRLYCAETDRFSNSDFYVKKGKNIPCSKTRARDPSNPNNLWQRAWELWLNSHLAGVAGKSLKKGNKPCKNWVQGEGENVQHRKLSGTYIILMYSRMW